MTRIVDWKLSNGMNGCDISGEVEIEDDASQEDIEAAVRDDMWNFLDLTWKERGKLNG